MIGTGAEPFYFPGGPVSCLLIHGFTSTPQEMRWLGVQLNEAGFSVLGLRLSGHATHPSDLHRARWKDWMASTEDGFSILKNTFECIVVIGLSLGGSLALLCGATLPVSGVVAIKTPYRLPPYPKLKWPAQLMPFLRLFSAVIRYLPKPPPMDYHDPQAANAHLTYPVFPTRAIPEVEKLLAEMRWVLPKISAPTLIIHSIEDQGVPQENAMKIFNQLGTKKAQIIRVRNSGHTITVEPERARVATAIIAFINTLCGSKP